MALRAVANPAAGGQPGSFTTLTVSGNATVGGALTVTGAVNSSGYSIPWGDNREFGLMQFSATYYAKIIANAATRELRLEAGGATGDPAAVNVRIGVDGTPTTVASFGPLGFLPLLATSAAGLPAGTLWNNAGTVKVA